MSDRPGIADQYVFAVESFVEFARTLDVADWSTPIPCTPEWTARDVLSHVSGIPDDAAAGRMEGAPGEAWTASQVERNRGHRVGELLDRWVEQTPQFAQIIGQIGEYRPPIDCHSHEHDIRHALGRPGRRSNAIIDAPSLTDIEAPVRIDIAFDDGSTASTGDQDAESAVTLRGVSRFELFRSRLGRRSRSQVRAYDWVGADDDIETVLADWFSFGPSPFPIVE